MKLKFLSYFIVIFLYSNLLSQSPDAKRDYIWVFGYPDLDTNSGNIINFNTTPFSISSFPKKLSRGLLSTNASICDKNGNYQLLLNGCEIYDASFNIPKNGALLNPSNIYNILCNNYGMNLNQNAIILPKPRISNEYWCIYKQTEYAPNVGSNYIEKNLLYTTVKIDSLGTSTILERDKIFFKDTMTGSELTACRHANGIDWWLLNWGWHPPKDSSYYMHLVTKDSIFGPYIHTIGTPINKNGNVDQVCFSPCGKHYARFRVYDGLHLYNFDRNDGLLSNHLFIPIKDSTVYSAGIAFSSDSKLLYIGFQNYLLQLDLSANNILKSIDTVAIWDGFKVDNFFPSTFLYCYLGPDCKIYVTNQSTINYLTIINYPNRKGKACEVVQHGLKLQAAISRSLPNFPNFRLGAENDNFSPCDSSINPVISGVDDYPLQNLGFNISIAVYPNPTHDLVNVDFYGILKNQQDGYWNIYDLTGKLIKSFPVYSNHLEYVYDVSHLNNGMYIWQYNQSNIPIKTGKLIIQNN